MPAPEAGLGAVVLSSANQPDRGRGCRAPAHNEVDRHTDPLVGDDPGARLEPGEDQLHRTLSLNAWMLLQGRETEHLGKSMTVDPDDRQLRRHRDAEFTRSEDHPNRDLIAAGDDGCWPS